MATIDRRGKKTWRARVRIPGHKAKTRPKKRPRWKPWAPTGTRPQCVGI
jgi:hypothetical protein